jgi:protein SCO1/2/putative membrane protein
VFSPALLFLAASLPPIGEVHEFELLERSGQIVTHRDLRGKVWIGACTYSCCTMSCPQIRAAMRRLQDGLRPTRVMLVSFAVDPNQDTPEQLRAVADAEEADPARWWFLTRQPHQPRDTIRSLLRESFQVDVTEDPMAEPGRRYSHTSRFFLVNRQGQVVGSYSCVEPLVGPNGDISDVFVINEEELGRLQRDAERLDEGALSPWLKLRWLPTLNAILNGTSACLLLMGFILIRRRFVRAHVACMLSALAVSALFLASYVYYHSHHLVTKFTGGGWSRPVYFVLLVSHTLLAMVVVPLVVGTLYLAVRQRYVWHRRLARVTLPIWLYVSITGVRVYLFLYHFFAA